MGENSVYNNSDNDFPDTEDFSFGLYFPDIYNMDFAYPINGFIIPILAVIILFTNTLFVIVFIKGGMNSPTHIFLRFMAIFDAMTVVLPTPCFVYMFMFRNYNDYIPYDLCVVWDYFTLYLPTITHNVSIWLTVSLAVQRFMCVCYPLSVKLWCRAKQTYIAVIVICIIAFGFHTCLFFEKEIDYVQVQSKLEPTKRISGCFPKYRKWVTDTGTKYFIIYYWFRSFAMQIIPCIAMVIFNGIIVGKIREAEKRRKNLQRQNTLGPNDHREHRVTTWLVIAIVNSVLIVEIPVGIFLALYAYMLTSNNPIIPQSTIQPTEIILNLLILVSYPLHFVLYSCMSSSFRQSLRTLVGFRRICPCRQQPQKRRQSNADSLTEISHL